MNSRREDTADIIRQHLGPRLPNIPDGTVVSFKMVDYPSKQYTYVALYVAGRWYHTGCAGLIPNGPLSTDLFFRLLARASEVQVAVEWESLTP